MYEALRRANGHIWLVPSVFTLVGIAAAIFGGRAHAGCVMAVVSQLLR